MDLALDRRQQSGIDEVQPVSGIDGADRLRPVNCIGPPAVPVPFEQSRHGFDGQTLAAPGRSGAANFPKRRVVAFNDEQGRGPERAMPVRKRLRVACARRDGGERGRPAGQRRLRKGRDRHRPGPAGRIEEVGERIVGDYRLFAIADRPGGFGKNLDGVHDLFPTPAKPDRGTGGMQLVPSSSLPSSGASGRSRRPASGFKGPMRAGFLNLAPSNVARTPTPSCVGATTGAPCLKAGRGVRRRIVPGFDAGQRRRSGVWRMTVHPYRRG